MIQAEVQVDLRRADITMKVLVHVFSDANVSCCGGNKDQEDTTSCLCPSLLPQVLQTGTSTQLQVGFLNVLCENKVMDAELHRILCPLEPLEQTLVPAFKY